MTGDPSLYGCPCCQGRSGYVGTYNPQRQQQADMDFVKPYFDKLLIVYQHIGAPVKGYDFTDEMKVKLFNELRAALYPHGPLIRTTTPTQTPPPLKST